MDDYLEKFRHLRLGRGPGGPRPHKPCLLLSVIDLFDNGTLTNNLIPYDFPLLERFHAYFSIVRTSNDAENPFLPFFYLESDGFWHLVENENFTHQIGRSLSGAFIRQNYKGARLDDELYQMMLISENREKMRHTLITCYFSTFSQLIETEVHIEQSAAQYRAKIENDAIPVNNNNLENIDEKTRDRAFAKSVKEAYDYRCSATGIRLLYEGQSLVEAAHIIPWSETQNDDPRNGIALSRNIHWAFDLNLIAPGPDLLWHVSKTLDDRILDNKVLLDLHEKPLILPKNSRFAPRIDFLETRIKKLL